VADLAQVTAALLSKQELFALVSTGFQALFMRKPRRSLRGQLTFSYHRP